MWEGTTSRRRAAGRERPDAADLARHLRYSERIGETLASVAGTLGQYRLTGRERYVQALVTSNQAPERPVWKEQRRQAWTRPVGWKLPAREPPGR